VSEFRTYDEFFPYYVAMHRHRLTRQIHLVGTLTGLTAATVGLLATRKARWIAAFPLSGYGAAWPSHFLVERNNPATFGHPAWSLRGDFQMIRMMLSGRDATLQALADTWFETHSAEAADVPATAA
jgi:hypothetical protein